jgi:hypothetical protein
MQDSSLDGFWGLPHEKKIFVRINQGHRNESNRSRSKPNTII